MSASSVGRIVLLQEHNCSPTTTPECLRVTELLLCDPQDIALVWHFPLASIMWIELVLFLRLWMATPRELTSSCSSGVFQSFFNLTMVPFLNMSWDIIISNTSLTCGSMDGYGSSHNPQLLLILTEHLSKSLHYGQHQAWRSKPIKVVHFGSPCR